MSRRKFTKSDFAAMNKLVAGVRYPPSGAQDRPPSEAATRRKPKQKRRSR